jgi:hypothetical protein
MVLPNIYRTARQYTPLAVSFLFQFSQVPELEQFLYGDCSMFKLEPLAYSPRYGFVLL